MKLRLSEIDITSGVQVRSSLNNAVVAEYSELMAEGVELPPPVVFRVDGKHVLADGFHRVAAAKKNCFLEIEAEVRDGTYEDAVWFALGANRAHGQRLSRCDIRRAVELALRELPDKTQQAVADQVGCTQQYVGKIRASLNTTSCIDTPSTITNSRGQKRPAAYKKGTRQGAAEAAAEQRELFDEKNCILEAKDNRAAGSGGDSLPPLADGPAQNEVVAAAQGLAAGVRVHAGAHSVLDELKRLWLAADEATREAFLRWLDEKTHCIRPAAPPVFEFCEQDTEKGVGHE